MNYSKSDQKHLFHLPPKDILEPNGPDDPLPYYYKPVVGRFYCARIKHALSLLKPPYHSILELGYGSGVLLPTLCNIGNVVSGIDIDSNPVKVSANLEKMGVHASLIRGDVSDKLVYSDDSFDLVVAISILEHIRVLSPVVNGIYRILRPGGEFLVGMPRVDAFMERIFYLIGYDKIKVHHVTDYRQFLKAACEKFELVKLSKMPGYVPTFAGLYFNMLLRKPK